MIKVERTVPDAPNCFTVLVDDRQTIAGVLDQIRADFDPDLRYRINCLSAQCGACVVRANGCVVRACDTSVVDVLGESSNLTIEPAPGVVLCDLITDLELDVWALIDRLDNGNRDSREVKELVEQGWVTAMDEPC